MSNFIDFSSAKKLHEMQESRNRITELFNIQYPIIQAGMIWHSGWRLASAVSNCGGLGLIGSASMYPDILRENIQKCKKATDKPFGVNVALLYPNLEEIINIILEEGVKIVFTSAGSPKTYTETLQKEGLKVAHVVSSTKFAMKCEEAGVDAVVAEGPSDDAAHSSGLWRKYERRSGRGRGARCLEDGTARLRLLHLRRRQGERPSEARLRDPAPDRRRPAWR